MPPRNLVSILLAGAMCIAAQSALAQSVTPEPAAVPQVHDLPLRALPDISPLAQAEQALATADIIASQTDVYDRLTVPVTIGGQGPFRFMIDTGAQATVVTRGLTERLSLKPVGAATIVGMGSTRPVELVGLDGLEFAQRVIDTIQAPVLEERNIGADGILGLDSLQDLRVMIDFRAQTIAVNDADVLGGNRGYEIIVRARHRLGRLIITNATVDGVRTALVLDTGAQSSFGNAMLKRRLRTRKLDTVSSTDVNGVQITGDRHFARAVEIQGLQLNNVPITFTQSPAFAALGLGSRPALILGMRDLRLFNRVAIDFASREVLFDVPSDAALKDLRRNSIVPPHLP